MRRLLRGGMVAALATAAVVFGLSGSSKASEAGSSTSAELSAMPYHLRLHHLHTGEDIDVVYRVGDTYLPDGLERLNYFLRDHRTQNESSYDPKEFDLLHALMTRLGRPNGVIDIVCGYRTPWSNKLLRRGTASSGVAEHSQHMLAKAIDIRVPGVGTAKLRDAALSLHGGGVGYYPVSQFVHVDVGPVREWAFGRVNARTARAHTRSRSGSVAGE
ncbi:MAG TPA: DUF882 domain-containing protein [Edaphobacter sp.]|nr:DUF882 domain-containing protein [Edaphobacter sp.]